MTTATATHVIDWTRYKAALKLPLTIETLPESIYTGDAIDVYLYCADDYTLISPYNGLSAKKITPKPDSVTEIIELSGSAEINAKYPIKSIESLVVAMPLVDEISRSIVAADVKQLITIVNQQLKVNGDYKLHGAIKLVYKTFDAQTWTHKAFSSVGRALLFAQNNRTGDIDNVALSINARSKPNSSIKIEGRAVQPKRGFEPYHAVMIYPSRNKKIKVKVKDGTLVYKGVEKHTIKSEQITFSGNEFTTAYPINALKDVTGDFYDVNGNEIQPRFRLSDGVIKSNVMCYGVGFVEYETSGLWYDYNAKVVRDEIKRETKIYIGLVYAFEEKQFDKAVSYQIPAWQSETKTPIFFYKVRRKVLTVSNGTFEYPPNWSNGDNTYPNQATAPDERPSLDDKDTSELVWGEVEEEGWVDINGAIDYDRKNNVFYAPYSGSAVNPDAQYDIDENIPNDIVDTSLVDKLKERIAKAKEEWGIA